MSKKVIYHHVVENKEKIQIQPRNKNKKVSIDEIDNNDIDYDSLAFDLIKNNRFSVYELEELARKQLKKYENNKNNIELLKNYNRTMNMIKYYMAAVGKVVKNIHNPEQHKKAVKEREKRLKVIKEYYFKNSK